MRTRTGRFWPTAVQERLLVAALGVAEDSPALWRGLPPAFSLDELEPGSFELMPLIYRNLSSAGHEDELLPRLKGIYRRTWVKNNLLLERTRDIAERLRTGGIRALFLEGAAFALTYYPDLGLRPTSSVHVLVGRDDETEALARLKYDGWSERVGSGAFPGCRFLFDGGGSICVLRTTIAFDFVSATDTVHPGAPVWEAAETREVAGAEVLLPQASDALLAVCVAGARLGPIPRTQWITDAAMLLRNHEIDWDRLLAIGIAHGQAPRLRAAFEYLARLPAPHPPREVRARLDRVPVTRRQRLAYALASGSVGGLGGASLALAEHLALTGQESLARTVVTVPAVLRERWGLEHGWQLPLAAGRRVIRAGGKRAA